MFEERKIEVEIDSQFVMLTIKFVKLKGAFVELEKVKLGLIK